MIERLNPSAHEVLAGAQREAAGLSHYYIGTEHLLLGLLGQPTGPAVDVLRAADLLVDHVRSEVVRLVGAGCGGLGPDEADALSAIGIDLDEVRSRLENSFGEGVLDIPHATAASGSRRRTSFRIGLRFTRRAKKCVELALRETRRLGHDQIAPEHILLGIIEEAGGIAAQILAGKQPLGKLRNRLLAELDKAA